MGLRVRESTKRSFYLLVYSTNTCKGQSLVRPQAKTRNLTQDITSVSRTGHLSHFLLFCRMRITKKRELGTDPRPKPVSYKLGCGHPNQVF